MTSIMELWDKEENMREKGNKFCLTHVYVCMYAYICVCVCMYVYLGSRFSCRHVLLEMTDKNLVFRFLLAFSCL